MKAHVSVLCALLVALTNLSCGPADEAASSAGTWVGTITTEGNVTTVVNESGSVWGGTATLVEEASIGVDVGEDPYMLGRVRGVAASDRCIYVIDSQVAALRVYDWNGNYLHDLGREGEGPGEFRYPTGVGVDGTGRVWLHDQISLRIVVFSPSGEPIETSNLDGRRIGGNSNSIVVTADGQAYVLDIIRPDDPLDAGTTAVRRVMKPYDVDGMVGEPIDIPQFDNPAQLEARRADGLLRFVTIPFHANGVTAFAPSRAVLSGYSAAYRFEVRDPSGLATVIERTWEPITVHPAEATAHERAAIAYMRDMDPEWVWKGPAIPTTKPAFTRFVPAASGEIWVVRPGPATLDADCEEDSFELDGEAHCWPEERVVDVFEAEGRYLGEVSVPVEFSFDPLPFIRGNDIIARAEYEAGTIMVKRYRLVLPGDAEH